LLWFIRNVKENIDIKISETDVRDYYLRVDLKGKFRLSKRDVHLKLVMTPNNPKYEGMEEFSKAFAQEFLSNDIVTYEGHVNGGGIFDDSFTKYKDLLLSSQNKNLNYQIFAIHSCVAGFFFHPDKLPKIDNPTFKRDVIRTAGPYIDATANGSLAIIGQVDSYL